MTGDGAYKIGGGENGSYILIFLTAVVFAVLAIALITSVFWWAGLLFAGQFLLALKALFVALSVGMAFKNGYEIGSIVRDCGGLGSLLGLIMMGVVNAVIALLQLTPWTALGASILSEILIPDFTDDDLCSA